MSARQGIIMAQTQKTIRFNQLSDNVITEICPSWDVNYNFAVNQIIHRYSVLCKHLKPIFSENEFLAIAQAYNGKLWNADIELEAKAFTWQIKESIKYDENVRLFLGDDLLITEFPGFIEKIEELTIPEIIALFQSVHEFWTRK